MHSCTIPCGFSTVYIGCGKFSQKSQKNGQGYGNISWFIWPIRCMVAPIFHNKCSKNLPSFGPSLTPSGVFPALLLFLHPVVFPAFLLVLHPVVFPALLLVLHQVVFPALLLVLIRVAHQVPSKVRFLVVCLVLGQVLHPV